MKDRLVSIILLLIFVAVIWVVYLVNSLLFDGSLNRYGLSPMALPYRWLSEFEPSLPYLAGSLRGILLSPLLHGSFSHLMSNTFPLLLLGGFVALRGAKTLIGVSLLVIVLGGFARLDRGTSGSPHWRKRAGLRLLRLPRRAGLVRTEHRVDCSRRGCAAAVRRDHLRRTAAIWLHIVGRAPVRADSGCAGGAAEQG